MKDGGLLRQFECVVTPSCTTQAEVTQRPSIGEHAIVFRRSKIFLWDG